MTVPESIRELQAYIDERWTVAQPKFYPDVMAGPQVPPEVTPREAHYFLSAVRGIADEPPLLVVDDDRKERSDRYPRLGDGSPRGYHFFEAPGRLRLETIVHWAAIARLRDEFGWPREHLIFESPSVLADGREILHYDALDILLLEQPVPVPPAKMSLAGARSRIGVEAKADAKRLDRLLTGIRACQLEGTAHHRSDHAKCAAIAALRPQLFLGVAAADTWRLFTIVEHEGRPVLGEEQEDVSAVRFA